MAAMAAGRWMGQAGVRRGQGKRHQRTGAGGNCALPGSGGAESVRPCPGPTPPRPIWPCEDMLQSVWVRAVSLHPSGCPGWQKPCQAAPPP